eukprot:UN02937
MESRFEPLLSTNIELMMCYSVALLMKGILLFT